MDRKAIPKPVRESVLREFNHRCAICGTDKPHLHHIDENPSNNDPNNLIPLCPNHHLLDQHAPTIPINPIKLGLFRRFKDPAILAPQFEPLFKRFVFLVVKMDRSSFDEQESNAKVKELVSFVSTLEMGEFYGKEIARLLRGPMPLRVALKRVQLKDWVEKQEEEFFDRLCRNREEVIALVVELLRYQKWPISSG